MSVARIKSRLLTCDLEVERKKDWEHRAYTTVDGRERKMRKREGIFNVDRVGEYVVSTVEVMWKY